MMATPSGRKALNNRRMNASSFTPRSTRRFESMGSAGWMYPFLSVFLARNKWRKLPMLSLGTCSPGHRPCTVRTWPEPNSPVSLGQP